MEATLVLLLAAMPVRMGFQCFRRFECLRTHRTLIRTMRVLVNVFDVHVQPMWFEFFVTNWTFRRFSGMDFIVHVELRFRFERETTHGALMRTLAGVNFFVVLHVTGMRKRFVAYLTGVRSFLRMDPFMDDHVV